MRMPKMGEKGFTLIELLIVVAILGVLAAVIIPNVGRFMGRAQTEAAATELATVQSATISMMVDNGLAELNETYISIISTNATDDMSLFPAPYVPLGSATGLKYKDPTGTIYQTGDKIGFVLYQHDLDSSADNATLTNYLLDQTTRGTYYMIDKTGKVGQASTGY